MHHQCTNGWVAEVGGERGHGIGICGLEMTDLNWDLALLTLCGYLLAAGMTC